MAANRTAFVLVILCALAAADCARPSPPIPLSATNTASENNVPIESGASATLIADGPVNDYAQVLDADAEGQLEKILIELADGAGVEVAIVTVGSTNGRDIYDYSLSLAKEWNIGAENGGALLVVASEDRAWHLQIDNRLEQDLTNQEVKQIGDTMTPDLKQNNYAAALKGVVKKLIVVLEEKQGFNSPRP